MTHRILFTTMGSLGDLYPYLALGRELAARGHHVTIATFSHYRSRVEAAGLDFHPTRPDLDPTAPEELRRVMARRKGAEYAIRHVALGHLRDTFEDVRAAARGVDLIVTHPITYAAQLVARASGLPWISTALSPVSLYSATDPPVYAGLPFENAMADLGPGFQRWLLRFVDRGLGAWLEPYRTLEAELGLPPAPNPILTGQHSPHAVLALFSPVLSPPQEDWPAHTRATGFPFLTPPREPSAEIRRFLEEGPAPLVFTLGSAAVGAAGSFYRESVAAAAGLGMRALLLVGHDPQNQPQDKLPPGMMAVPFAPHSAVFPHAVAIVHQGGIGTTGEAMRAGRPMLVVPHGHDQPDHAHRLERLGIARTLRADRYDARRAYRALKDLLEDDGYARRARGVGVRVRAERGVAVACDVIERVLEREARAPRLVFRGRPRGWMSAPMMGRVPVPAR